MQKDPGWSGQQIGTNIRGLLKKLLETYFGKKGKVCSVWVNGDSACFSPVVGAPQGNSQISGSGKDANKNPLPDLFTPNPIRLSGGGMGVYTGQPAQRGYNLDNAATWGSGVWIFCGYVGKKLVSCTLVQD